MPTDSTKRRGVDGMITASICAYSQARKVGVPSIKTRTLQDLLTCDLTSVETSVLSVVGKLAVPLSRAGRFVCACVQLAQLLGSMTLLF